MTVMSICATLIALVATLLPLWRKEHWVVRSFDFPRLQLLVAFVMLLLAGLLVLDLSVLLNWLSLLAVLFCCIFQLWWILPYSPWHKKEVQDSRRADNRNRLSLMNANVLMSNRNADALIALVREYQPDILVTLESDSWWQARLDALEDDYPHTLKCPLDNMYGMHVYSRLPLHNGRIDYLVEDDKPSMQADLKLPGGQDMHIHFVHPAPPSPTENTTSGPRDKELVVVARRISRGTGAHVVSGDLNDVAWSETTRLFRKISGLLDPRVGRGMYNTFHANYRFLRWPLDHLFVSEHFTLCQMCRLPAFGSDHFAFFAEVAFEPRNDQDDNGLDADSDDRTLAREKIS